MFNEKIELLKGWFLALLQEQSIAHPGTLGDTASTLLTAVIATVYFLYAFFGLYVLVMGLYRAHLDQTLSKGGYFLGAPWLVIGWIVDFVANMTIFVVIFLELPREALVTSRLQRHLRESSQDEWRYKLSKLICERLLDYFDPRRKHC